MKGAYFFLMAILFYGLASYLATLSSQMVVKITSVLLLIAISFFFMAVAHFLLSLFRVTDERKKNLLLTAKTLVFLFIFVEMVLRWTGLCQTYSEKSWGGYAWTTAQSCMDSWFFTRDPNSTITADAKEFKFHRRTNTLGLSDMEIPPKKAGAIRIIALGDSFTEGVGVSYDSTWVNKLGTSLNQQYPELHFSMVNAGVGGSDPVYEYMLFQEKLIQHSPDLVLMVMNGSDVAEIAHRGGFERFNPDGTTGSGRVSWEWIYASNHIVRGVMHVLLGYNHYLVPVKEMEARKSLFVENVLDITERMSRLSVNKDFRVLYVIHPLLADFMVQDYGEPKMLALRDSLTQRGLSFLDLRAVFENKNISNFDEAQPFYWPIDQHFNQRGYDFFCMAVRDEILRKNWFVGAEKRTVQR